MTIQSSSTKIDHSVGSFLFLNSKVISTEYKLTNNIYLFSRLKYIECNFIFVDNVAKVEEGKKHYF